MTAQEARAIIGAADYTDLLDGVREWANCKDADVDDKGNIWIADPQRGHWLDDDRLVEFVTWAQR